MMPTLHDAGPDPLHEKALEIQRRLCAVYGCPIPYFHHLDPLSELVSSLLSHRTRNHDSGTAFKALRRRFPTWREVMEAPTDIIEETIAAVTWPEQKAPRIQQVLREIARRRGELSLEFLGGLPVGQARAWLRELPGVGPKTSAATLLFSLLRMPALPIDSHHYRVAIRTGLIGPRVTEAQSHTILAAQLPAHWPAQDVYDNHEVMMIHGQRCCFPAKPACPRCSLLDLCPEGQGRTRAVENGSGPSA